jgi:hypothetical protein
MSQDKQREPKNQRRTQPSRKPIPKNQPFWKASIIQLLRGTIGVLETTVVKLETETPTNAEKKTSFLQKLDSSLARFIRTTRLFIPSRLSDKLSDTVLLGILAVIAVVIVWTTANFFLTKTPEVATVPPVEVIPTPTPTPAVTTPPEPEPTPKVTPIPEVTPVPEPTPEVIPIPEVTPIPEPTPEVIPIPEPKLTPEQALVAAVKNQFSEISQRTKRVEGKEINYDLIESLQANFRASNLIIKISNDWYTFKASTQNKLAAKILQRSQELNFIHLEIVDSQDKLIARNPVVGNEMVIFKRQSDNSRIQNY